MTFSADIEREMERHAIRPEIAVALGVTEDDGGLVFPYRRPDDSVLRVRKRLGENPTWPADEDPLAWWPLGRRGDADIFLCGSEEEALAICSALFDLDPSGALLRKPETEQLEHCADLAPVVLPRGEFDVVALAHELRSAGCRDVTGIELEPDVAEELEAALLDGGLVAPFLYPEPGTPPCGLASVSPEERTAGLNAWLRVMRMLAVVDDDIAEIDAQIEQEEQ